MKIIDFKDYIGGKTVLSGRNKGEKLRESLDLEKEDLKTESVKIIIPREVDAYNSSYFLGSFGKSVRHFGKEKFLKKYQFDCSDIIMLNILDGIEDALNDVDLLGGK